MNARKRQLNKQIEKAMKELGHWKNVRKTYRDGVLDDEIAVRVLECEQKVDELTDMLVDECVGGEYGD